MKFLPDVGARPPRQRQSRARWIPTLLLGGVLGYLVLVPILMLVRSSLSPDGLPGSDGWTLQHFAEVYSRSSTYRLFLNTVVFAISSTVIALTLGVVLAWLVERTDMPHRNIIRLLVILPMAMPPMLLAMAWALLLSPQIGVLNELFVRFLWFDSPPLNIYSMAGMAAIQGLSLVPTAFLILGPSVRNMDPSFEEAAFTSGASTGALMRHIVLPLISPAILAVAAFMLILGVVVFDIPGTLGQPGGVFVLSSVIVVSLRPTVGFPAYGEVSALSMSFFVLLIIFAVMYYRYIKRGTRFATISGKGYRARPFKLGRWRKPAAVFVWSYFGAVVVMPFLVLLWTSFLPYYTGVRREMIDLFTFDNHTTLLTSPSFTGAVRNSVIIAVVAATSVTFLGAVVSWTVVRSKARGRQVLDVAAFTPLAIPGVLIGMALIYVYLFLPVPVYGTIWIITIAYVTHYLAYGTRVSNGVMLQIHGDLEEAAHTSGATWLTTFRRVTLPLIQPALVAVWLWVAAHSLRELSAALILQGRRNTVLPVLLFDYWEGGRPTVAAAAGVWLILGLFGFVLAWYVLWVRRGSEDAAA